MSREDDGMSKAYRLWGPLVRRCDDTPMSREDDGVSGNLEQDFGLTVDGLQFIE